jgi:hypothetical protein
MPGVTTEREDWAFDGRHYMVTLASTPDTMDLELDDVAPSPSRGLVLMASRDDESGAITLRTFTSEPLALELLERFVGEAQRQLPPE